MKIVRLIVLLYIVALVFCSACVYAHSWEKPRKRKFYNESSSIMFEVIPGMTNRGKNIRCQGILYIKKDSGKIVKVWRSYLENKESPAKAIISPTGEYVVTFDDWGRIGYGDNVVVIYDKTGSLIGKFGLEDILSEDEILKLSTSLNSRIWSTGEHSINEQEDILSLKTISEKEIDLKTGKLIVP